MEIKNKSSYFIKINEFQEAGKKAFIAAILSLFFGFIGVHRFYLNRRLSGFLFLITFVSSIELGKGNMAALLIIISIIESIVYFFKGIILIISKHKIKNRDKDMDGVHNIMKNNEMIQMTMESYNDEEINIIEVSNTESSKILNKDKSYKIDWINKLEFPYDINLKELNQVERETFILYLRLCDFLDEEFRQKRSSLVKENRKIYNRYYYGDNLFETIYHISSSHIFKTYSGNYSYYNPEYYYRILEAQFNKNLRNRTYSKAQELEKEISPPTEETLKYFYLTKYRTPIEWWDKDGELRNSLELSDIELNILKVTTPRNTKAWAIYEVKKHIINLYLEIWKIIYDGLDKNYKWRKRIKSSLEDVMIGQIPHYADFVDNNILEGLVKLSENTIRELIPNMQILNISNDKANIQKYLPKEIVSDIYDVIIKYKENIRAEELKAIIRSMVEKNPNDWKLKVQLIMVTETDKQKALLISYECDNNFTKIAKEIVKKTENEELTLLCLYGIEKEEKLTQKNYKLLENMIHPSNISQYKKILESKKSLSIELMNELFALKSPTRKKIDLDMKKVEVSKKELTETVEILQQYIGEETNTDEKEEIIYEIAMPESDAIANLKHGEFLKLILGNGSLNIEDGKKIALENGTLLNAFISKVNSELYNYVNDQVIIIDDEDIKIDDFYVDIVKELIANEA